MKKYAVDDNFLRFLIKGIKSSTDKRYLKYNDFNMYLGDPLFTDLTFPETSFECEVPEANSLEIGDYYILIIENPSNINANTFDGTQLFIGVVNNDGILEFYGTDSHDLILTIGNGKITSNGMGRWAYIKGFNFTCYKLNNNTIYDTKLSIIIQNFLKHEGFKTATAGLGSHAEGFETKAIGMGSHAEAYTTTAHGNYSHSEGTNTKANGRASHSEGNDSIADGDYSHTEGNNTKTIGDYSHAEGDNTEANNYGSHSEGGFTKSSANFSHAEGFKTEVTGLYSHVEGNECIVSSEASHAEGKGSSATALASHAEGEFNVAGAEDSHAEGYKCTVASTAIASHAEGRQTNVSGTYSHAEGSKTNAIGNYGSHAEGANCTAQGESSHAEGYKTGAGGENSHVEGIDCSSNGYGSHAEGYCCTANARYQHVQGSCAILSSNEDDTFIIGNGYYINAEEGASRSNCFRVTKTNGVFSNGEYQSTGADYAEYFEWEDNNLNDEDRTGLFVTLEEDKIRLANKDDDFILGIVSATPSVLGDTYDDQWKGMYLTDVFGRPIYDDVKTTIQHSDGTETEETIRHFKLNPNYNKDEIYIPRSQRKEWGPIGMLGKLVIVDDGTPKAGSYCEVTDGGIGTHSNEKTNYRVLKRIDNTHSQILILSNK